LNSTLIGDVMVMLCCFSWPIWQVAGRSAGRLCSG